MYKIQVFDSWMHIKAGEINFLDRTIHTTDPFSHTAAGREWINHQWLAQIVFFLITNWFGVSSLVIFKVFIAILTIGFLYLLLNKAGIDDRLSVVILTFAMILARSRFSSRPEIFTLLFASIFLFILYRSSENKKLLLILPPMMTLWVNFHAGYLAGFIILGSFCLGALFEALDRSSPGYANDRGRFRVFYMLGGITILCAFFALINPGGLRNVLYPFLLKSQTLFMDRIMEWRAPELTFTFIHFWIAFFVGLILVFISLRRMFYAEILLFAAFAALAFGSRRHIGLFGLVLAPIIARIIQSHLSKWSSNKSFWGADREPSQLTRGFSPLRFSPLFYLPLIILVSVLVIFSKGYEFGVGVRDGVTPEHAADFILNLPFEGNMLNPYHWGGYLLFRCYPDIKVFIDGRSLMYGEKIVKKYEAIMLGNPETEKLLNEYKVDLAVINFTTPEDPNRGIQDFLYRSDDWNLIYWDNLAMVYLRNDEKYLSTLDKLAYKVIDPNRLALDYIKTELELNLAIEDIKQHLIFNPENTKTYNLLAMAYGRLNNIPEAINSINEALTIDRKDTDSYYNLGYYLMETGKIDQAISAYKNAVKFKPTHAKAWNNLGNLYEKTGKPKKAERAYRKAFSIDPNFEPPVINLTSLYMSAGERGKAEKFLLKAVKKNNTNPTLWNNLGNIYAEQQIYNKAASCWQQALKIDPDFTPARENLGKLQMLISR